MKVTYLRFLEVNNIKRRLWLIWISIGSPSFFMPSMTFITNCMYLS